MKERPRPWWNEPIPALGPRYITIKRAAIGSVVLIFVFGIGNLMDALPIAAIWRAILQVVWFLLWIVIWILWRVREDRPHS